jgi:hypothetical protein
VKPGAVRREGWVYILTNPAMPGLLKIGCTKNPPEERARELSQATGVPASFAVAWAWPVSDWKAVEALTHAKLGACRPNGNREFFCCSVSKGRRSIKRAARAYLRPAWLRLLLGPRRHVASARSFRAAPRRSSMMLPVLAAAALVVLVAECKPAPAFWLPSAVRSTVSIIESVQLPSVW